MGFLIGLLLFLPLFYGFLIAPGRKPKRIERFAPFVFSHRGLHSMKDGIPENSLPAFAAAVEKGYGIELDVHLTLDGQLVVMHDRSLLRMCGVEKNIDQLTLTELSAFRLASTQEIIPTLDAVLKTVDAKVPLILELKYDGRGDHVSLPQAVHEKMQGYEGAYCVESFDPLILRWYRKHAKHVLRGQLAFDQRRKCGRYESFPMWMSAHLLIHFLSRPIFVAYQYDTAANPSFQLLRRLFRPLTVAWTVPDAQTSNHLSSSFDWQIFENFEPNIQIEKEIET